MSGGDIAGLVAAVAFVALVALCAVPLLKLGRTFDETTKAVRDLTEHSLPVLDETATLVATSNTQLDKVDQVTTAAASVSQNVSALTALFAATVGGPMVKVAAFTHGVRRAMAGLGSKRGR